MKREFLFNVVLLLGINLVIKPFYLFGIDRVVQNTLPPGVYGLYFTLLGFAYIFQVVNDFGLANFNSRQLAQYRHLIQKYFPSLLQLKLILIAVYLLFLMFIGLIWGHVPQYAGLLLLIGINLGLTSLLLFLRSNLAGLGHYRRDSLLSALDRLLLIIILGVLLWTPTLSAQFQLWWFVVAQTVALIISCTVVFWNIRRFIQPFRWNWQFKRLFFFLRESAPYALVIFLMTAYTRLDAIMLERLLEDGLLQADLYAGAFRLLDAANALSYLFAVLLLPMFARQIKQGESVKPLTNLGIRVLWLIASSLAVAAFFYGQEIMDTLYQFRSPETGAILTYLMIAFVSIAGSYVYGTLLTANGDLKQLNIYFTIGILLNLLLNWWLIPQTKALGAAQATALTQGFVFVTQVILAKRKLGLDFAPVLLLRLLLFPSILLATGYGLNQLEAVSWFVKFCFLIASIPLWALALGMIQSKDWKIIR